MKFLAWIGLLLASTWSATAADACVTLAWDPNPEPDVACYVIYYGTASRQYAQATNVGNVTLATVRGLQTNTVYHFAITAVSNAGLESEFSDEVTNRLYRVILTVLDATNAAGPWRTTWTTNITHITPPTKFWLLKIAYDPGPVTAGTNEPPFDTNIFRGLPPTPWRTNR